MAALRQIAEDCDFGATLEDATHQDRIQRALLAKTKLTFETAYTKARAMEMAEKNSRKIQTPQREASLAANKTSEAPVRPLLRMKQQRKSASKATGMPKCYRCNESIQTVSVVSKTTLDRSCPICRKRGHIAKACRNIRQNPSRQRQETHCIEASEDEGKQADTLHTVHQLGK